MIRLKNNELLKDKQNENKKAEIENDKNNPSSLKLIFGIIYFILIFFHAIYKSVSGAAFLFKTSFGLDAFIFTLIVDFIFLLPFNILFLILIIDYIKDLKKKNNKNTNHYL